MAPKPSNEPASKLDKMALMTVFHLIENKSVELKAAFEDFFREPKQLSSEQIDELNENVQLWVHCEEMAAPLVYAEDELVKNLTSLKNKNVPEAIMKPHHSVPGIWGLTRMCVPGLCYQDMNSRKRENYTAGRRLQLRMDKEDNFFSFYVNGTQVVHAGEIVGFYAENVASVETHATGQQVSLELWDAGKHNSDAMDGIVSEIDTVATGVCDWIDIDFVRCGRKNRVEVKDEFLATLTEDAGGFVGQTQEVEREDKKRSGLFNKATYRRDHIARTVGIQQLS